LITSNVDAAGITITNPSLYATLDLKISIVNVKLVDPSTLETYNAFILRTLLLAVELVSNAVAEFGTTNIAVLPVHVVAPNIFGAANLTSREY
jgi:hypothetical protein